MSLQVKPGTSGRVITEPSTGTTSYGTSTATTPSASYSLVTSRTEASRSNNSLGRLGVLGRVNMTVGTDLDTATPLEITSDEATKILEVFGLTGASDSPNVYLFSSGTESDPKNQLWINIEETPPTLQDKDGNSLTQILIKKEKAGWRVMNASDLKDGETMISTEERWQVRLKGAPSLKRNVTLFETSDHLAKYLHFLQKGVEDKNPATFIVEQRKGYSFIIPEYLEVREGEVAPLAWGLVPDDMPEGAKLVFTKSTGPGSEETVFEIEISTDAPWEPHQYRLEKSGPPSVATALSKARTALTTGDNTLTAKIVLADQETTIEIGTVTMHVTANAETSLKGEEDLQLLGKVVAEGNADLAKLRIRSKDDKRPARVGDTEFRLKIGESSDIKVTAETGPNGYLTELVFRATEHATWKVFDKEGNPINIDTVFEARAIPVASEFESVGDIKDWLLRESMLEELKARTGVSCIQQIIGANGKPAYLIPVPMTFTPEDGPQDAVKAQALFTSIITDWRDKTDEYGLGADTLVTIHVFAGKGTGTFTAKIDETNRPHIKNQATKLKEMATATLRSDKGRPSTAIPIIEIHEPVADNSYDGTTDHYATGTHPGFIVMIGKANLDDFYQANFFGDLPPPPPRTARRNPPQNPVPPVVPDASTTTMGSLVTGSTTETTTAPATPSGVPLPTVHPDE